MHESQMIGLGQRLTYPGMTALGATQPFVGIDKEKILPVLTNASCA